MTAHQGQTDKATKIKLQSTLDVVMWSKPVAALGGMVGLEVFTHHVGRGAEIQIELTDKSGKAFGKFKDKIAGNRFWADVRVPKDAKEELFATVKLPKHSLSQKSAALLLGPAVEVTNLKWDKKEARRGDILKMTADVKGAPDGTEALVEILERDTDGAHDLITKFPVEVKNKKVEVEWEYEYHEDTDEIPTKEEAEKGYNPPEYFFRVSLFGITEDSPVLGFKDWIEIRLQDKDGHPLSDHDFTLVLADGKEIKGKVDKEGKAMVDDVPPGPFRVVT